MDKTYRWRIALSSASFLILLIAYTFFCESRMSRCLWGDSILVTRTIFHFTLSLLVVSPVLFFVRDEVFKKWLRFAGVWFGIAAVLVILTPESSGGWGPSLNPTKESVSIWMASLFVIISLVKIAWDSRKKA
jgi:hypothetical protein